LAFWVLMQHTNNKELNWNVTVNNTWVVLDIASLTLSKNIWTGNSTQLDVHRVYSKPQSGNVSNHQQMLLTDPNCFNEDVNILFEKKNGLHCNPVFIVSTVTITKKY
jgi:hypothetical protein